MAYVSSQARDQIRTAAAGLRHSNTGSKPHLWPSHSLQQHQILNPLMEARDQTHTLMDTISGS